MANFAARLANRIQANPRFWADYQWLCANGVVLLTQNNDLRVEALEDADDDTRLIKLIESASCLAMNDSIYSHKIAQTIALYSVATSSEPNILAACEHILAQLGNFPAADFVRQRSKLPDDALPTVVHARNFYRRYQNTVALPHGKLPLTDFQLDIWADLEAGHSAAISAPTSAGKSYVVRQFLVKKIKESQDIRVAYVVPTRALMAEIHEKLSEVLGHDDPTIRITSVPTADVENRPRQIFVVTQERLLSYLDEGSPASFDYVVVDEAQQMGDGSRGMILQDCLERINDANPACAQYFMAPMASRVDNLALAVGRLEVATHLTVESPVISTKVVVKRSTHSENELVLEILDEGKRTTIARLTRDYGFADRRALLANVCVELGSSGGSLIYASGPADAEDLALQIAINLKERDDSILQELAAFIQSEVHADYSLAFCVKRGVGFHYGAMPTLLRQALEDAFRSGTLSFLACTTTLFQGVNLPARNVFIDKVRRGTRGTLEREDIWNFIGRAGRLMHDVAGNVFLVDYDNWAENLLDDIPTINTVPALTKILEQNLEGLERYIESRGTIDVPAGDKREIEAAAGLLISRYRKGVFQTTVSRCTTALGVETAAHLEHHLEVALSELVLPPEVLDRNWQISPWRLQNLFRFLATQVINGKWRDYCPSHPMLPESYERYERMFGVIEEHLNGKPNERWVRYLNYQAIFWMKGEKISTMVNKELAYNPPKQSKNPDSKSNSNKAVRKIFDLVEKTLRFTCVQNTRAYCDCLRSALVHAGLTAESEKIFPVPLALELGACSKTMVSLVELGLSRISAQTLSKYMKGSDLSPSEARTWLRGRDKRDLLISNVVLDELLRLRLIQSS
ncbi:DEAD/DEAH box helicase [Achromobacter xylosoxidans]|uniref:DEAD/DEAH box helicase n=1 Tax=Alcaligenes xylosoxydans xylosoxydans TaxID=85698 RepID=UPI003D01A48D